MNIISEYAEDNDIDVKCRLVGSMAKKTSLIDKADIDIFMTFPLEYSEDKLKSYGLELGNYCINKVDGKSEKRYASHPYITGIIDGFEIDFVPCYRIKDSSQLKSAVDRTILHTDYIQSHLTDNEADEVLLLKKFMTSINTYGANYKVSGFSGYLCELLILEYHSFENVILNAATKWHEKYEIDLENYGTCNNYNDPLIVIDPVDKNRNVAAALSMQKFSEFIIASRNFIKNKKEDYFYDKHIHITKEDMLIEYNNRGTNTYVLSFNVPELPTDVIYPQVNKTMNSLVKISKRYDFNILSYSYYINSNNQANIILEYNVDKLSDSKIHIGPLVSDENNCNHFKRKYSNAYVMGKKLVSVIKREYTTVIEMIGDLLKKENIHLLKVGKNIKEEVLNKYQIMPIVEVIENGSEEDLNELYLHVHPNYLLDR